VKPLLDLYFDFTSPYGYGEPFWGVDRLHRVERWLATGG
jgi:2-hydroxychromene-2-carboxylate isomerase